MFIAQITNKSEYFDLHNWPIGRKSKQRKFKTTNKSVSVHIGSAPSQNLSTTLSLFPEFVQFEHKI